MPIAARVSGMYRVVTAAANALENPVHSTTSTKISQTWLASHTGPMELSIRSRACRPRSVPPASRSHTPPPKSAPPNSA
jgi:hypothetical protein